MSRPKWADTHNFLHSYFFKRDQEGTPTRDIPVPPGTNDSSPVRFRGAFHALKNKCRVSEEKSPSLRRRPARSASGAQFMHYLLIISDLDGRAP
jgi:hypothetical protein